MNNEINLIGNKDHVSAPTASRKLKIMRALAVLLLFGVSAASVILYILISFSPLPQVQQQERDALSALSVSHPEMTKIALLQDRLTGISTVLAQRNKYDSVLESVTAKMPQGVSIFQISMSKKNLTLTVRTTSLDALTTFVANLREATSKKEYTQVTLNSIISDSESNNFSLTVSIGLL
jgi:Tfp pilus assembly protein PilN